MSSINREYLEKLLFEDKKTALQLVSILHLSRQGVYNLLYSEFGEEKVKAQFRLNSSRKFVTEEEVQAELEYKEEKELTQQEKIKQLAELYANPGFTLDDIAKITGVKDANQLNTKISRLRKAGYADLFPKRNPNSGNFKKGN